MPDQHQNDLEPVSPRTAEEPDFEAADLDARLRGTGTDPQDTLHRAATDPLIDPSWPEQAQRIIGEKHAQSARQGDVAPPETDSEAGAAETGGPKSQTEPVNMEYEHENQGRWREIRM